VAAAAATTLTKCTVTREKRGRADERRAHRRDRGGRRAALRFI
jgi:hypothetical protein